MMVIGVDGCAAGWVFVALEHGHFAGAGCFPRFAQLLEGASDATAIGVDMPIGLLARGERRCDAATRDFVGPRRSSVFSIGPRPAIEAEEYATANALNRELCGKGLSKQAYNLREKILEIDSAVKAERRLSSLPPPPRRPVRSVPPPGRSNRARIVGRASEPPRATAAVLARQRDVMPPAAGQAQLPAGRIVEVHPEASFCQMAGEPLRRSKKTYNGLRQRLALLQAEGIHLPEQLEALGDIPADDVLDAAAVAWSARRYVAGEAVSMPLQEDWQHEGAQVIAIWR